MRKWISAALAAAVMAALVGCSKSPDPDKATPPDSPAPTAPSTPAIPSTPATPGNATPDGPKPDPSKGSFTNAQFTYTDGMEPTLIMSGRAAAPEVKVAFVQSGKTLWQTTAQVKDGRYQVALTHPKITGAVEMVVTAGEKEITRLPVPQTAHVGTFFSANFQSVTARKLDSKSVWIEGKARVFEAVFRAEVHGPDGKLLATANPMTDDGAPAFGKFMTKIEVPENLPEGAEVWFIVPSANDPSFDRVEIVAPLQIGK